MKKKYESPENVKQWNWHFHEDLSKGVKMPVANQVALAVDIHSDKHP